MTIVFLVTPFVVRAQACPANQVVCDNECQAPDSKQGNQCQGPGGQQGQFDACGNCANLACPGQQILCSGNCQAAAAQCPPNSNRVYNQCTGCGGCATDFIDCNDGGGFDCKATENPACASPATWDPCAGPQGTCTENYVRVSPSAAQSGFISMQGDLRSGGDVYLNSGRAIRIDGAGATELNLGNWAQGGAGANVFVWGNLNVGGPEFLRNLTVSGNLTVTGTVNGLNLANAVLTTNTYANPAFITNLAWNKLTGFPAACPAGPPQQFVTAVGGALTCAAPPAPPPPPPGGITEEVDPIYAQWFSSGNPTLTALTVGNISATTVNATGCFGPLFRQLSTTKSDGQAGAGGYAAANGFCPLGLHVCTDDELLKTINCGAMPAQLPNEVAWLSAGPPGHISTGNDCNGWQDGTDGFLGRIWDFPAGSGAMMPCNSEAKFTCCQ